MKATTAQAVTGVALLAAMTTLVLKHAALGPLILVTVVGALVIAGIGGADRRDGGDE